MPLVVFFYWHRLLCLRVYYLQIDGAGVPLCSESIDNPGVNVVERAGVLRVERENHHDQSREQEKRMAKATLLNAVSGMIVFYENHFDTHKII